MKLLSIFSSLLLTETEEGVLVVCLISDWHVSESGCKSLQNLLLSLFCEEKLHVAADGIVGSLIDTNKIAPFGGAVNTIVHDLASSELSLLLENSCRGITVVDISVINICLSNNTKSVFANPSPESNCFWDLALLYFSFGVEIKDLDNSLSSLCGSQSNNILGSVH